MKTKIRLKTKEELRAAGFQETYGSFTAKHSCIALVPSMLEVELTQDEMTRALTKAPGSFETIKGWKWCPEFFTTDTIDCDCSKEKHGFMTHESWCSDYITPHIQADLMAPIITKAASMNGYNTSGDVLQQQDDQLMGMFRRMTATERTLLLDQLAVDHIHVKKLLLEVK